MQGAGLEWLRQRNAIPWLIVAVSIVIGYQAVLPPAPSVSADVDEFSAERAFAHIEVIAASPHPMGSTENAEVRQYLVTMLEDLGIETQLQTVQAPDYYGGTALVDVVNVIARIPGANSTGTIALVAHYDTFTATPGANDNSVAVAALLETARALEAGPAVANDVLLVFTDGEEPAPRPGSTAFVADSARLSEIRLVVNFEASGGSGASIVAEINGPESWVINGLSRSDNHPAAFSALTATTRLLGDIGTDFDEFANAGVPGLHFAYLHGSPIYHTERDNISAVNKGSLQHHGNHALGIARHFGQVDLSRPGAGGESVYFPVRPFFVHYRASWAVPLMIVIGVGLVAGLVRRRNSRGPLSLRRGTRHSAVFFGLLVAGTVIWVAVAAARPTLGHFEGYAYFLLLIAGATAAIGGLERNPRSEVPAGAILVWLGLSITTAIAAPGLSYLFAWPTAAATIAVWWHPGDAVQDMLRFGVVAIATLVVAVPMIDILSQFAYPRPGNLDSSMPVAALVPLLLSFLVVELLRAFWPTQRTTAAPTPQPE